MDNHELSTEVAALRHEVAELKATITDLVDAWRTANGVVRFIKWLSSAIAAGGILIAAFKGVHFGGSQ